MNEYRVAWAIDVDGDSPREAAQAARDAQTREGTIATVFQVARRVGERFDAPVTVDLEEPEEEPSEPVRVPDFVKDITGHAFGGAYWNEADYRIIVKTTSGTMFMLTVEDSSGGLVFEHEFTDTQADRLRDLVRTSEEADDEGLGLSRELHWRFEVDRTQVDLDLNVLDEIAEWIDTVFDAADGNV